MSAQSPNQPAQQASGTTTSHDAAIADLDAFFQRAAASPAQARLQRVTGTCLFDFADVGKRQVSIKDGVITVAAVTGDAMPPADCVISTSAQDFVRILRREGNMNMLAGVLQGRVMVTGDLAFAMNVIGSYTVEPASSPR